MRKPVPIIVLALLAPIGTAHAQEDGSTVPATEPAADAGEVELASTAARAAADHFQVGVALLPMLLGRVATGPTGDATSSNLDFAYGVGVSFGYRVLAGLSVGIAPQALFHLTSRDSGGYSVIDAEKEFDLMARIAYAHTVVPTIEVYAELLPGYSFVTYDQVIQGSKAPRARGMVLAGGLGATFAVTRRLFANASLGYQQGFQTSHGISDKDVRTRFLRIALGGGVRF